MLVVARLLDGRKVKGRTTDFHPERPHFTIRTGAAPTPARIALDDLKALYFVRSLEGNPNRRDQRDFPAGAVLRPKIWLEFKDGEEMAAWPVALTLEKSGFYVLPTDSDSNVEKAYVRRRALKRILEGKEAERAARRYALRHREARLLEISEDGPRLLQLR